jgi:hypothetical protein
VTWNNSTLIRDEVAETVARLKEEPGAEIQVTGSGELIQTLLTTDGVSLSFDRLAGYLRASRARDEVVPLVLEPVAAVRGATGGQRPDDRRPKRLLA